MAFEDEIVQTIEGDTLEDCRIKLFELYGHDFQIRDKQTIFKPTGFLHLHKKEVQKVYYVVNHRKSYEPLQPTYSNIQKAAVQNVKISQEEELEKNRQAILQNQSNILVNSQLKQMSSTIEEMNKTINSLKSGIDVAASEKHETIKKIDELLEQNEFTFSYIQMIEDKIRAKFPLDQLDDFKLVERYVIDWIGESINIAPEKSFRPPHVIINVGPTGVGKTTTIAKLAANTIIDAKSKGLPRPQLCILTIDTMRVGALEQLSKFGEILGREVLKAETSDDVLKIYEDNKDHVDYIFIDTSGYSPNDSTHIGEMKNILSVENMNPDVYLSLCATTKASDLNNIIRNYEPFGYESVIVTKCDETKQIGNIISVLYDKHKSISYITDGQRVPRNIRKASVIDLLKSLNGFDVDRVHIEDKFGEK